MAAVRAPQTSVAAEVVRRHLDHLVAGTTDQAAGPMAVQARRYVDRSVWERERSAIFRRTPSVVALSSELREAGDYKTVDLGGLSAIVVRGRDGRVRAFVNQCTHRGTALVEGRGQGRRFVCPFHGWGFDHDGNLQNNTSEEHFCGIDRESLALIRLPVREELGLVWTVGDPAVDLASVDLLAGMEDDVCQLRLDRWHYQYSATLPGALHWRMFLEGIFETYHLPYLHARTAAPLFHCNVITYDAFGPNFRLSWPRRTIDGLHGTPPEEWVDPVQHVNLMYYLFPNTVLLNNAGMWRFTPGHDVGAARMEFNFFTIGDDASMSEAQRQRFEFALTVTREEDNPAAEAAFRNYLARPDSTVVFGANEVCIQHMHRALDATLTDGL